MATKMKKRPVKRKVKPARQFVLRTLTGLPGVSRIETQAACFNSVTAGMQGLKQHGAITTAGSYGAINIWKDDLGNYRCQLQRWMARYEDTKFAHLGAVDQWLRDWLPTLENWPEGQKGRRW